ncbi:MAG: DUF1868 domain-containing protein [Notoacmeibacter sp.]
MIRSPAKLRADSIGYLTGAHGISDRPSAVGQKFSETGAVLPFVGNTFICHIPKDSEAFLALTDASLALQNGPLGDAFTFLPASSFHMTVFEGITDANRKEETWPKGISLDAEVVEVTDSFEKSIQHLALPSQQSIRPTGLFGGFSVSVTGSSSQDENSLRQSRILLRGATQIQRADFEEYGFHITLAYLLRWLTTDEAELVMDHSDMVFDRLLKRCTQIALNEIEFCTFENMHQFNRACF